MKIKIKKYKLNESEIVKKNNLVESKPEENLSEASAAPEPWYFSKLKQLTEDEIKRAKQVIADGASPRNITKEDCIAAAKLGNKEILEDICKNFTSNPNNILPEQEMLQQGNREVVEGVADNIQEHFKGINSERVKEVTTALNSISSSKGGLMQVMRDFHGKYPNINMTKLAADSGDYENKTFLSAAVNAAATNNDYKPLELLAKWYPKLDLYDSFHDSSLTAMSGLSPEAKNKVEDKFKEFTAPAEPRSSERTRLSQFDKDPLEKFMIMNFDDTVLLPNWYEKISLPLSFLSPIQKKNSLDFQDIQKICEKAIYSGKLEYDVNEEKLNIPKMRKGMKDIVKLVKDHFGEYSRRDNTGGLYPQEIKFLNNIDKYCSLLPNGGISVTSILEKCKDRGDPLLAHGIGHTVKKAGKAIGNTIKNIAREGVGI
jgi:hypothetical protein